MRRSLRFAVVIGLTAWVSVVAGCGAGASSESDALSAQTQEGLTTSEGFETGSKTAYAAANAGELPIVRVGRRMVVPRFALEKLLMSAS